MRAVVTAEFLDNIPAPIRLRLNLKPGAVLDFDEKTPYLKAVPAESSDETDLFEFQKWLDSSIGIAKGKLTTDDRLRETRGED